MHQSRFRWGFPAGELTALYQTASWNKRDLLLREGEDAWKGKEREEKGREGVKGEETRGRLAIPILVCFWRRYWFGKIK